MQSEIMATQYARFLLIQLICILYVNANELLSQEEFDVSNIDGQQLEDEFYKLNEFLVAKTASADPEKNFNLVLEKYKSDSKRWFKKTSSDSMKAKRLFLAMGQITDQNRCEPRSYNILIQIDRATFDRSHRRLDPEGEVRRVERILLDYALKQKAQCHEAHLKQYMDKLATMEAERVKRVEGFLEPTIERLISEELEYNRSKSLVQRLYGIINEKSSSMSSRNPINILESLKQLTKDDSTAKIIQQIDNDADLKEALKKDPKVREVYNQNIVDPCRYYVNQLEPIFKTEYFENKFQSSLDEGNPGYYGALTCYHLCNLFVAQVDYTAWQDKQLLLRGKNQLKSKKRRS